MSYYSIVGVENTEPHAVLGPPHLRPTSDLFGNPNFGEEEIATGNAGNCSNQWKKPWPYGMSAASIGFLQGFTPTGSMAHFYQQGWFQS